MSAPDVAVSFTVRVVRAFWFAGISRQVGELVKVDGSTAGELLFSGRGELANAAELVAVREAIGKASARAAGPLERMRTGFVQTGVR